MSTKHAPPPSEEAMKSRILTHMNADHTDSLALYLQHHHNLPSFRARKVQLTDLSFTTLTLSVPPLSSCFFPFPTLLSFLHRSRPESYTVPISPPLESWSDARARLVAMDQSARKALGLSDIKVREYIPPDRWWMYTWTGFLVVVFGSFSQRGNFLSGSLFYESLDLGRVPALAKFGYGVHPLLWGIVIPVHIGEVFVAMVPRLRRFNVGVGRKVWWMWVASIAFEGFAALMRFDELVGRLEGEKRRKEEGKDH